MEPFVCAEPYLNSVALTEEDRLLIIACDGVWDELEDQVS